MTAGEKQQSNQLYHVIVLLCRQQPLTEVVNSTGVCPRTCGEVESRETVAGLAEQELRGWWQCMVGALRT